MKKYLSYQYLKWPFTAIIITLWIKSIYSENSIIETGELAWRLLIFIIMISLFQKISQLHFPKSFFLLRFLPLRKEAGILTFLIATSHAILKFIELKITTNIPALIKTLTTTHNAVFLGSLALLIMLPIFLSSNNWSIKKLGRKKWKTLQRTTHIVFILAGLHLILIHYFEDKKIEIKPLIPITSYCVGYSYLHIQRLIKRKNSSNN